MNKGARSNLAIGKVTLEDSQMTATVIGVIIIALAIEVDKLTQYRHFFLPLVALAGVLVVAFSLALKS